MSIGWLIALTAFYFASGIAEAFIAKKIADEKGYKGIVFFIVTCLSNVLGLLCVCVLSDKNKEEQTAKEIKALEESISALSAIISAGEERADRADREREENARRIEREMAEKAERERRAAEEALAAERRRAAEIEEQKRREYQERVNVSYYDDGEANSLGWQVSASAREQAPVAKSNVKANSVLKDGRLVCSNCGKPLKFNDKMCRSCGAEIVPVDGSNGGFFRKK